MRVVVALFLAFLAITGGRPAVAADAGDLSAAVQSACGCSIVGVVIGKRADSSTWSVQYAPSTNSKQKADGDAVLATFDINAMAGNIQVSRMQALVALNNAGLLTAVQNWVAAQDANTQLIWNNAPNFTRNSALLNKAGAALGLTSAQIDQLFVAAAAITP